MDSFAGWEWLCIGGVNAEKAWRLKAMMNGFCALATGITFIIVGSFKFFDGAWIAILLISNTRRHLSSTRTGASKNLQANYSEMINKKTH